MSHKMPHPSDEAKLYGHVASLPCQLCGKHGVQISHSNQAIDGKGLSLRSYPWRVAALCPECHVELDSGNKMDKVTRRELWNDAHRRTVGELFRLGLIRPV